MPAITRLCPRTILLDNGKISGDDVSHRVVSTYLGSGLGTRAVREWPDLEHAPGNDIVRLRAVRIKSEDGQITDASDIRKPVAIEMEYEVLQPNFVLVPNYHFINEEGVYVFVAGDQDPIWRRRPKPPGCYVSTAWIPGNFLTEGGMIVGAAISTMDPAKTHFWERDAVAFQVIDHIEGDSARGDYGGPIPGVVRPILRWVTDFRSSNEGKNGSTSGKGER
jgi:lipopolysaccharide transport system ATP-binding protein